MVCCLTASRLVERELAGVVGAAGSPVCAREVLREAARSAPVGAGGGPHPDVAGAVDGDALAGERVG